MKCDVPVSFLRWNAALPDDRILAKASKESAMTRLSTSTLRLCIAVLCCLISIVVPPASAAGGPPAPRSAGELFAAGRLLVKFHDGTTARAMEQTFAGSDLTVQRRLDNLGVYVVGVPEGEELSLAEQLGRDPAIAYAEPDYIYEAFGAPNDPMYATHQWNLLLVNAPEAWDITTGASDVIIAVIDTGVDLSHPDLAGKIVEGVDFVNGDEMAQDDEGHGTHVAGIAAALTNNATGVAGIAWGARIMPIKVLDSSGSGYASDVAAGIAWSADHGAHIINLSLGSASASSTVEDAVSYAYDRGSLIVAAAGNEYLWGNAPLYPAAYPNVMAVAATNDTDEHARYSNTGAYVDVAAPGGDPDSSADGDPRHWIMSTLWSGGSTYGRNAGTSMATPHAAGLAALVWSRHMGWTNDQVEWVIESSAVDLGDAGRDDMYGWGRIDMLAAVKADTPPPPPPPLCLAESVHPYGNDMDQTWSVTNPDEKAGTSRVHFSRLETEIGYDFVNVRDGYGKMIERFSGSYAGSFWSGEVPGRAVQIQLVSDYSISAWGFCVDQIETVDDVPDIDVTPASISVLLGPGRTADRGLVIGNMSGGALYFSLSAVETAAAGNIASGRWAEPPAKSEEASAPAAAFDGVRADADFDKAPLRQSGAPQGASAYSSSKCGLGSPMFASRYRLAGVSDNNLRYFAIGGNNGGADLARNEVYDPTTDSWTTLAPMPSARMNMQAAAVDGVVYVPGGYSLSSDANLAVHEAYDIASNTWTTRAPLPQPLSGANTATLGGKVFLFGGRSTSGFEATAYQYDPTTDAWVSRSAMPVALAYGGAVEHGGQVYVVTGVTGEGSLSAAFLRYDPISDSWAEGPGLNTPRMSPAVITVGDYVYVIGGGGCGGLWEPCSTAERYYLPAFPNGQWEVVADVIPSPVVGMGYAYAAGKMWLAGGVTTGYAVVNLNQYLDERLACKDVAWLSVSPISGSVAAGDSLHAAVTFDATGLELGTYWANVIITSNDPDEPQVVVPVTLKVAEIRSVYLPLNMK
jgi:type VII secretion-associated serine protease mycosin